MSACCQLFYRHLALPPCRWLDSGWWVNVCWLSYWIKVTFCRSLNSADQLVSEQLLCVAWFAFWSTQRLLKGGQSNPGIQQSNSESLLPLLTVFCSDGSEWTKTFLLFTQLTKWFIAMVYWVFGWMLENFFT